MAEVVKNTPEMLIGAIDSLTKKTLPGLWFVGLPAATILGLMEMLGWKSILAETVLGSAIFITLTPLAMSVAYRFFGGYIERPIWAIALALALPAWIIKFANKLGKGKGVSGFGLMLAFYGVLQPLLST